MELENENQFFENNSQRAKGMDWWLQNFPQAWAEMAGMGKAKNQPPIHGHLKGQASPATICQYPMSKGAQDGIRPHILCLLQLGILQKCQSVWNILLLPVQKPGTNDYCSVRNLRKVNKQVTNLHPTMPNPYKLLSSLPPSRD